MSRLKLYMILLGATPPGRMIEQHDIFFGIAKHLKDLVPDMKAHWPEAKGRVHIDAYQEVRYANGYEITVEKREETGDDKNDVKLFFINLGGYKPGEFEEYHYKMVVAAADRKHAVKEAKKTAFFKHMGYKGAEAHIDDKYGIDVDDIHAIEDILAPSFKEQYCINLRETAGDHQNELNIGYYRLDKL